MILTAAIIVLFLLFIWICSYRIGIDRRTRQHQKEWNAMKADAIRQGRTKFEIDNLFLAYINKLMAEGGYYGACLPKK